MPDRLEGTGNTPSAPDRAVRFCFVCGTEFETNADEPDVYCSTGCYQYDGGEVPQEDPDV